MAATSRSEGRMRSNAAAVADDPSADILARIQAKCLLRGAAGIKGLGRVFRNMDDDGNKKLNFAEFKKGLKDFQIFLESDKDYRDAFERFDTNHDGSLDFDEFLIALRPKMNKTRMKPVKAAFDKLDKDGNGTIDLSEVKRVYDVRHHPKFLNGQMTDEQIFKEFLKNLGDDGDGKLTFEEFVNYYAGVSASIDDDMYFDLMMRKAWKL